MKFLVHFFIFLNISFLKLNAQDFIVVLIGNTMDPFTGHTVSFTLKKMEYLAKNISEDLDIKLKKFIIKDLDFNTKTLLDSISKIQVQNDDIILLYYMGHGYRSESTKSKWPNIAFDREYKGISHQTLTEIFLNKNPYFLLSLADTCNNTLSKKHSPLLVLSKIADNSLLEKKNIKNLFNKPLFIMASGAKPGLFSYCDEDKGGHFTFHFIGSLEKALYEKAPYSDSILCWQEIFLQTSKKLEGLQEPQFEIHLLK